jgi:hypothetical protein
LQEISLRLTANNLDESQEKIPGPHGVITQAQADISLYLRRTIADIGNREEHVENEVTLDVSHRLKQLEIQLGKQVKERFPDSASHSSTDFEDIDAYDATVDGECIDDSSDSESVNSGSLGEGRNGYFHFRNHSDISVRTV